MVSHQCWSAGADASSLSMPAVSLNTHESTARGAYQLPMRSVPAYDNLSVRQPPPVRQTHSLSIRQPLPVRHDNSLTVTQPDPVRHDNSLTVRQRLSVRYDGSLASAGKPCQGSVSVCGGPVSRCRPSSCPCKEAPAVTVLRREDVGECGGPVSRCWLGQCPCNEVPAVTVPPSAAASWHSDPSTPTQVRTEFDRRTLYIRLCC